MADVIEAWARSRREGHVAAPPDVCRGPGCQRRANVSGLCRTHYLQQRRGQPLRPIQSAIAGQVQMGSLRLPAAQAARL
jgi:hypothetical protein